MPLPAGGCGSPRVTATRGGRRPSGPGLGSPGRGSEQRRQTRRQPPCRFLPAAPVRWAGRRRWLLIREEAAAATTQTTATDASLRLSREEPNHRKKRYSHLSQSAPALGTPARLSAPLPSNPRTRANQKIRFGLAPASSMHRHVNWPQRYASSTDWYAQPINERNGTRSTGRRSVQSLRGGLSHLAPAHWLLSLSCWKNLAQCGEGGG